MPVTNDNDSGRPLWTVTVEQHSKTSGNLLNTFTFNVRADNVVDAKANALKEVEYWSKLQTIHVDTQEFMKLQRRPWMRQTWSNARNIIISCKRVKG